MFIRISSICITSNIIVQTGLWLSICVRNLCIQLWHFTIVNNSRSLGGEEIHHFLDTEHVNSIDLLLLLMLPPDSTRISGSVRSGGEKPARKTNRAGHQSKADETSLGDNINNNTN